MVERNSDLHFLINKQLKRSNLSEEDIVLNKRDEWRDFLLRVSRTYFDQEQERYLIERSLEISSREMMDLNEKLESAQKIAHLGYWIYDRNENKLIWSKETFNLTGIDPSEGSPSLNEVLELIHEDDRPKIEACIERAFKEGKDYEIELRFKNKKDNKYYWHFAKGHPHVNQNEAEPIRYLSGIAIDITEKKLSEENLKKLHQQLLSVSRQAGMNEVATFVLHNIGNILNSASVSISLLVEAIAKSRINNLIKISDMIKEHITNKDDFLINDKSGKFVPDYLVALSKDILKEYENISLEINNINTHLNHIKDVVTLQKDISGIIGIKENIFLNEIVDLALQMTGSTGDAKEIKVVKNYHFDKSIVTEKAKLLQILVNLIRNARDSVTLSQNCSKQITISINKINEKMINIIVHDTGGGISSENITKIFSFGFTTKPKGHGFGLHSSAIAAIELGGVLRAESEGVGKGASFIIELPIVKENIKTENILNEP